MRAYSAGCIVARQVAIAMIVIVQPRAVAELPCRVCSLPTIDWDGICSSCPLHMWPAAMPARSTAVSAPLHACSEAVHEMRQVCKVCTTDEALALWAELRRASTTVPRQQPTQMPAML